MYSPASAVLLALSSISVRVWIRRNEKSFAGSFNFFSPFLLLCCVDYRRSFAAIRKPDEKKINLLYFFSLCFFLPRQFCIVLQVEPDPHPRGREGLTPVSVFFRFCLLLPHNFSVFHSNENLSLVALRTFSFGLVALRSIHETYPATCSTCTIFFHCWCCKRPATSLRCHKLIISSFNSYARNNTRASFFVRQLSQSFRITCKWSNIKVLQLECFFQFSDEIHQFHRPLCEHNAYLNWSDNNGDCAIPSYVIQISTFALQIIFIQPDVI